MAHFFRKKKIKRKKTRIKKKKLYFDWKCFHKHDEFAIKTHCKVSMKYTFELNTKYCWLLYRHNRLTDSNGILGNGSLEQNWEYEAGQDGSCAMIGTSRKVFYRERSLSQFLWKKFLKRKFSKVWFFVLVAHIVYHNGRGELGPTWKNDELLQMKAN